MDALFFPRLSLPGAGWTNPNLLFFEKIGVIAPDADRRRLFDGPTRILIEHELVEPVSPMHYARADEAEDERVIAHCLGMTHANRGNKDVTNIHLGKISYTHLPAELRRLGLLWPSHDREWLEGPVWVIAYLMSVLAIRMVMHPEIDASLITNEQNAERLVVGFTPSAQARFLRRVRAVARLLPVGPSATIADIVRFRERYAVELRSFRGFIEALAHRLPISEEGEHEFEGRLREAEELRRHLVGELQAVRGAMAPVPLFLSFAAIAAPIAEHSPFSAATGVGGLGYLLCTAAHAHRRQREAMRDKLVYAALAVKTFTARRADDILR